MTDISLSRADAISYIEAHIGHGMKPGIDRIAALLEMMGNPEASYPVIHVAGTNGKTSVSRMATLLLVAHGITTGTFTSPHLERIEERFSLNGIPATAEQFAQAVVDLKAFADIYEMRSGQQLTYFELTAALALSWFADETVGAAVVEVGLGGRLDATNAVRGAVSVLTEVGIEHTEYLGDTIEAIAAEKLAIVEPESTLVTGPLQPSVDEMVNQLHETKAVRVLRYGRDFRVGAARRAVGGWRLDLDGVEDSYEDLYLPVHGRHQTLNLAVAVAAVEALMGRALDDEAVADATRVMSSPGRMEPVATEPLVLLDGAHNPDGFEALSTALAEEFPSTKWTLVTAAMRDKNIEDMYTALAPLVSSVVVTRTAAELGMDTSVLAKRLEKVVEVPIQVADDSATALEEAKSTAGTAGAVLVTGSLYLVGEIRAHVAGSLPDRNER